MLTWVLQSCIWMVIRCQNNAQWLITLWWWILQLWHVIMAVTVKSLVATVATETAETWSLCGKVIYLECVLALADNTALCRSKRSHWSEWGGCGVAQSARLSLKMALVLEFGRYRAFKAEQISQQHQHLPRVGSDCHRDQMSRLSHVGFKGTYKNVLAD